MNSKKNISGFGLIEAIVALGVFLVIASLGITGFIPALQLGRTGRELSQATSYSQEGIEAVRSLRDRSFGYLSLGNFGVGISNNTWVFSGTSDVNSKYIRQINITQASRDVGGSLVISGGATDPDTYIVSSIVNWNYSIGDTRSVTTKAVFTNWRKSIASVGSTGGIIVYGDGQVNTDGVKYRLFNGTNWGVASSLADIDTGTNNRYLRAIRVYASPTRNEKIAIARHYNGTTQYIYSQVFNGTTWGNISIGSSWTASTFLDVQNFDGTYLANGDFVMIYSDNTIIPKFKTWNGTSWSVGQSMVTLAASGVPNFIVAKARPGTNEIMVGIFDQASDTTTEYYNGAGYLTANWTKHTQHAATSTANTKKIIDYSWQPNIPTKGVLVFASTANDKSIDMKLFLADGSGGGSWGPLVSGPNQSGQNIGSLDVEVNPINSEAVACDKDSKATPSIYCFQANIATTFPVWSSPTNNTIVTATQNGTQQSFHFNYERSGVTGLIVYSSNINIPQFKKYSPITNTFDLNPSTLAQIGDTLAKVRLIPDPRSNDIMVLMGDSTTSCYTQLWDGTNHIFYNTAGRNLTTHGANGSVLTDYWFDFVWN